MLNQLEPWSRQKNAAGLRKRLQVLDRHWDAIPLAQREGFESIKQQVLRICRERLPGRDFLSLAKNRAFSSYDLYLVFDEIAHALSLPQVFEVVEHLGMPGDLKGANVKQLLQTHEHPAITDWLAGWIRKRSKQEAEHGATFTSQARNPSASHLPAWSTKDGGLSDALMILGRRADAKVPGILAGFLKELPWGLDRRATVVLLSLLGQEKSKEHRIAIRKALEATNEPGAFRLFLLGSYSAYSPKGAIGRAFLDLSTITDAPTRTSYLNWLWRLLSDEKIHRHVASELNGMGTYLRSLRTRAWTRTERGRMSLLLRRFFPDLDCENTGSALDRWVSRMDSALRRRQPS